MGNRTYPRKALILSSNYKHIVFYPINATATTNAELYD